MEYVICAVIAIAVIGFIYLFWKTRSFTGVMFGSSIAGEFGEVRIKVGVNESSVAVYQLESERSPIGLMCSNSSLTGKDMNPILLSIEAAEELHELLGTAIDKHNKSGPDQPVSPATSP